MALNSFSHFLTFFLDVLCQVREQLSHFFASISPNLPNNKIQGFFFFFLDINSNSWASGCALAEKMVFH